MRGNQAARGVLCLLALLLGVAAVQADVVIVGQSNRQAVDPEVSRCWTRWPQALTLPLTTFCRLCNAASWLNLDGALGPAPSTVAVTAAAGGGDCRCRLAALGIPRPGRPRPR